NYDTGMLKTLLDSTSMFRRLGWGEYSWSTGAPSHGNYVRPDGNVGVGLVAPPRYTRAFLESAGLIGPTRHTTIVRLLDWGVENMSHFYNDYT
ncbi:MAG TPA: hypothetical protein VG937_31475, partial [Polyangiaceae bacterium]|nr:hypothetical protein [Polyangiaceae bacterium]